MATKQELIVINEPDKIKVLCGSCKKMLKQEPWGIIFDTGNQVSFVCEKQICSDCNKEWILPMVFDSENEARTKAEELGQKVSKGDLSDLYLLQSQILTLRYYIERD